MVLPQLQGTVVPLFGSIISENAGLSLANEDARKYHPIPPSPCFKITKSTRLMLFMLLYMLQTSLNCKLNTIYVQERTKKQVWYPKLISER